MRYFGNVRLSYFNEERVEAMVQFVASVIVSYRHFHGVKRLKYSMQKANLRALINVFYDERFKMDKSILMTEPEPVESMDIDS